MAKEGITPAGHVGFEIDISLEETENLLRGFLESMIEEQHRGRRSTLPEATAIPLPPVSGARR